ncbi:hypothetical protein [Hyphomicrobium sp.]|uniref:hypothetical protein n=1 Tax=Hyphomicrobium sp. TaxID=82 RepID=UPI0025B9C13A|nr:hypothetical protein [Hyphomicrobium sp.]MCC7253843.1 hypothetical protein [Hyphomicrobium sp.]
MLLDLPNESGFRRVRHSQVLKLANPNVADHAAVAHAVGIEDCDRDGAGYCGSGSALRWRGFADGEGRVWEGPA